MNLKKGFNLALATTFAIGMFSVTAPANAASTLSSSEQVSALSVSPTVSPASKMVTAPYFFRTEAEADAAPSTQVYNNGVYYGTINVVRDSKEQLKSGWWMINYRGTVYKYVN